MTVQGGPEAAAKHSGRGRSSAQQIMIGAGWLIAFRVFTRFAGLLSTLVLARLLMPADFGLLAMATTFSAAVEALSALGLQQALIHWQEQGEKLYDAAFTIQLGRALLTAAVIALGAPAAAEWFGEPRLQSLVLVLSALTALTGLENIGIVEFRRDLRFDKQFGLLAVPRLLQVMTTIPLAWATHSYWALLAGIAVGRVARLVNSYVMHPYRPKFGLRGWRRLVGFSFWTWVTVLVGIVWNRMDPFILGHLFRPEELAIYVMAVDIALLPASELLNPAVEALFPSFASANARGTGSLQRTPAVAAVMTLVFAPISIFFSAAAGDIVRVLLGGRWLAAQPLVAAMAFVVLASPITYVASAALVACGRVRANFVPVIAMVLPKLVLVYLAAMSGSMVLVCVCNLLLSVAESGVYAVVLRWLGVAGRQAGWGMLRVSIATLITMATMQALGIGWQPPPAGMLASLLHGTGIGLAASSIYAVSLGLLWLSSRRPAGPETLFFAALREAAGLRTKLSFATTRS